MSAPPSLGVPQLERIVAPVPAHATLLFLHDPGVEAEPFLYQAAHQRLLEGGDVVYAVTNRPPSSVLAAMTAYGFDVLEGKDRLRFVDAYSPLMGMPSSGAFLVDDPSDPLAFASALEAAADAHADALLVVDSLSSVLDQSTQARFVEAFPRIQRAMRRFAMSEAVFTRWPYADEPSLEGVLGSFDGIVRVRAVEDRVILSQYFHVEKARWLGEVDSKPRLYRTLRPGGIQVYIPKIVVTGPYNAGKSSFIHSASDTAVSVDQLGTTVALDHGRVLMDGVTADVFGTPGQGRFDPLLRVVAGQALGVVVVVDSTKPESFPRAREMMQQTWRQGLPAIVAANKQDAPGALPPAEVARLLGAPGHVQVVGCSGQERESSRRVLRQLMDQILTQGVDA